MSNKQSLNIKPGVYEGVYKGFEIFTSQLCLPAMKI